MMRILITGGCGFIGSHLLEYHLAKGDEVTVVDDLSTGSLDNIQAFQNNAKFKFYHADLLTWNGLEEVINHIDRIYHFAASVGVFHVISDRLRVVDSNIMATDRLFSAIAHSKSRPLVIVASSSSAYGDSKKIPLKETDDLIVKPPIHPLSTYAISKIADEAIAIAYYQSHQIPMMLIRLFNTIGPRQRGHYGMVVPRFVQQACQHEPFTIFGDGNQTRSFCDVRDVVRILDLLSEQPKAVGEIINVGKDEEITINKLATLVCECTGKANASNYIPYNEAYGQVYTDIQRRRPDLSKLNSLIECRYEWTLAQTITDLIKLS